jgi:zinc transport system permease protein
MKIVGVLLITSLLIIPPATARKFSKTPEIMALKASIIGVFCIILGVFLAFSLNTPVGPSIVVVAGGLFLLSYFLPASSTA